MAAPGLPRWLQRYLDRMERRLMNHIGRADLHAGYGQDGGAILYHGDVTLGAVDPTHRNIQDASSNTLAVIESSVVLVWNGTIQQPGVDFTLDAAGEVMTLAGAMDGSLYVLSARRKPA